MSEGKDLIIAMELEKLQQENQKLKQENQKLKQENERLKKENTEYQDEIFARDNSWWDMQD